MEKIKEAIKNSLLKDLDILVYNTIYNRLEELAWGGDFHTEIGKEFPDVSFRFVRDCVRHIKPYTYVEGDTIKIDLDNIDFDGIDDNPTPNI